VRARAVCARVVGHWVHRATAMTFDCWYQHAQQQKRGVGVRDTWVMEKETAKMLHTDLASDVYTCVKDIEAVLDITEKTLQVAECACRAGEQICQENHKLQVQGNQQVLEAKQGHAHLLDEISRLRQDLRDADAVQQRQLEAQLLQQAREMEELRHTFEMEESRHTTDLSIRVGQMTQVEEDAEEVACLMMETRTRQQARLDVLASSVQKLVAERNRLQHDLALLKREAATPRDDVEAKEKKFSKPNNVKVAALISSDCALQVSELVASQMSPHTQVQSPGVIPFASLREQLDVSLEEVVTPSRSLALSKLSRSLALWEEGGESNAEASSLDSRDVESPPAKSTSAKSSTPAKQSQSPPIKQARPGRGVGKLGAMASADEQNVRSSPFPVGGVRRLRPRNQKAWHSMPSVVTWAGRLKVRSNRPSVSASGQASSSVLIDPGLIDFLNDIATGLGVGPRQGRKRRVSATKEQVVKYYDCREEAKWAARPSVVTWNLTGQLPLRLSSHTHDLLQDSEQERAARRVSEVLTGSLEATTSALEAITFPEQERAAHRVSKVLTGSLEATTSALQAISLPVSSIPSPHLPSINSFVIAGRPISEQLPHEWKGTSDRHIWASKPSVVSWNVFTRIPTNHSTGIGRRESNERLGNEYWLGRMVVASKVDGVEYMLGDDPEKKERRQQVLDALVDAKLDVESQLMSQLERLERLAGDDNDKVRPFASFSLCVLYPTATNACAW